MSDPLRHRGCFASFKGVLVACEISGLSLWANRLRHSSPGNPADALGDQLSEVWILEGLGAMAELKIEYARLPFGAGPCQRFAALRVRGGNNRRHIRLHAKAPINFIMDREILQPRSNRMIPGHDDNRDLDIVLIADLRRDHAAFAIRFRVSCTDNP